MIEYLRLCWHRWILRHWQIPRQNGAEPPAVICSCGITGATYASQHADTQPTFGFASAGIDFDKKPLPRGY